jgi:acetyl-CoA C-acetyltransferase
MADLPAPSPDDVVILAGARTPQGRLLAQLANLTAVQRGPMGLSD